MSIFSRLSLFLTPLGRIALCLGLVVSLFFGSSNFAMAETPEAAFSRYIGEMKASGNPAVLNKRIHWDTAYERIDPQMKELLEVNSPADFSKFYDSVFKDPAAFMRKIMDKQMASIPGDQRKQMEPFLEATIAKVETQYKESLAGISAATYEVKGSEIDGKNAVVSYTRTADGQKFEEKVDMIKVGSDWLMVNSPASQSNSFDLGGAAAAN